MSSVKIEPIRAEHIEGFHHAFGVVARERKYLRTLDAHPLERVRTFVLDNIANGYPQFVATTNGEVVGWCDIVPMSLSTEAHAGTLGMGLLPEFRGVGHGRQLLLDTLEAAQHCGLKRIELTGQVE